MEVGPENSAVAGVKFTFIHGKSSPQPRTARDIQREFSAVAMST